MRDPSYEVRTYSYGVIADEIMLDGFRIESYDEIAPDNATFPRIIFQGTTVIPAGQNKCNWSSDCVQAIKITDQFRGSVTKNRVDLISDQIMQLLVKRQQSQQLQMPSFKVWKAEAQVLSYQSYDDGAVKYIDKNIQIIYSLTEN